MANGYFQHIANVIAAGTRALAAQVNNIATEIEQGFDKLPTETELKQNRTIYGGVDTGAADAYVVALTYTPTLTDGLNFFFKAANANTGASTLNLNALGAKSILLASGAALVGGDILADQQIWLAYESNSDSFRIMSQSSSAGGGGGNATTIALLDESSDTTNFVPYAPDATGNQPLRTGTNLTFNSATGQLTATLLSGTMNTAAQPNITSVGTLTNFTSTGIDDNATGERLQIADTLMTLGASGASYEVRRDVTDQALIVSGGNSSSGGTLVMYGGTHATLAGDMLLRSGTNSFLTWDETAGNFVVKTGSGAKTTALTLDTSQNATFAGTVDVSGTNVTVTNATTPRIDLIDTTNTCTTRVQSLDGAGLVGTTSNHQFTVRTNNVVAATFDTSQNATFAGTVEATGDVTATGGTFNPTGDTAAADSAALGYTAAEGLILTGQGSTNDVTIKNDVDADVISIPTGTTNVTFAGNVAADNISFPATANLSTDANTLDDYQEGETSVLTFSSTAGGAGSITATSGQDTLHYTKIGRLVHIFGHIRFSAFGTVNAGGLNIFNMPFGLENLPGIGGDSIYFPVCTINTNATTNYHFMGRMDTTDNRITVYRGDGVSALTATDFMQVDSQIHFNFFYYSDD